MAHRPSEAGGAHFFPLQILQGVNFRRLRGHDPLEPSILHTGSLQLGELALCHAYKAAPLAVEGLEADSLVPGHTSAFLHRSRLP